MDRGESVSAGVRYNGSEGCRAVAWDEEPDVAGLNRRESWSVGLESLAPADPDPAGGAELAIDHRRSSFRSGIVSVLGIADLENEVLR